MVVKSDTVLAVYVVWTLEFTEYITNQYVVAVRGRYSLNY